MKVGVLRNLAAMMVCVILASCGGGPRPIGQAPGVSAVAASALPEPDPRDYGETARPYYIGPADKMSINVFGVPDLQRTLTVDAAGRVSFPLIGTVDTSGLTPFQLEKVIEGRLRERYIKDPQVTVNLEETSNQLLTVDGQVNKPGAYPVIGRMTLLRAVAVAGSTAEFAKLDDVVILRKASGASYAALYNLEAIRRGNYEDPEVFPNDVIVVGDSKQRRLFRDLLQVVPLLTTPLILLLNNGK